MTPRIFAGIIDKNNGKGTTINTCKALGQQTNANIKISPTKKLN